jgi:hypothetical protein
MGQGARGDIGRWRLWGVETLVLVLATVFLGATVAGATPVPSRGNRTTTTTKPTTTNPTSTTGPTSTTKPNLQRDDAGVSVLSELNVPLNSRVAVFYKGGNCTKSEWSGAFNTTKAPQETVITMFTAKSGDPWESCARESSNARFLIEVTTPLLQVFRARINVQQVPPVDVYTWSFRADCEGGSLACRSGGTDTIIYPFSRGIGPRVNFGPITDAVGPAGYRYCAPEGDKCAAPSPGHAVDVAYGANGQWAYKRDVKNDITCDTATFGGDPIKNVDKHCWSGDNGDHPLTTTCGSATVKVGDNLKDLHIATSDGNPLPKVTLFMDPRYNRFPPGLTWQRWPTAADTWLVLNGSPTEPGRYQWRFEAESGGKHDGCLATLDVKAIASDKQPPPTTPLLAAEPFTDVPSTP